MKVWAVFFGQFVSSCVHHGRA